MNTRIFLLFVLILSTSGCSLEATLLSGASSTPNYLPTPPVTASGSSGLSYGERVITTVGTPDYEMIGAFGEIPEKTTSLNNNNWVIEGTFYE